MKKELLGCLLFFVTSCQGREVAEPLPIRRKHQSVTSSHISKTEFSLLAIATCQKYGVRPAITKTILHKESSGGNMKARAFAQTATIRAKKISDFPSVQKQLSSAWGGMQIMGWQAARYGLGITELLDPIVSSELGCTLLAKCQDAGLSDYDTFRCYNGAPAYARHAMQILPRYEG